jgi:hypothetical protein
MHIDAARALVGQGCGIAQIGSTMYDLYAGGGTRRRFFRLDAGDAERLAAPGVVERAMSHGQNFAPLEYIDTHMKDERVTQQALVTRSHAKQRSVRLLLRPPWFPLASSPLRLEVSATRYTKAR